MVRASGQGIKEGMKYTGDHDDVIDFGVVSYEGAMELIRKLPPFSKEDDEAGLCPPAIILTNEGGNSLTISSVPGSEGRYDVFLTSNEGEGTVVSNADISKVSEVVSKFFGGTKLSTERIEDRWMREEKTLVHVSCKFYDDEEEGWLDGSVAVREKLDGSRYLSIWVSRHAVITVPLDKVIEVKLKRGGFLSSPSIQVKFIDKDGKAYVSKLNLDKSEKDRINEIASKFQEVLPGRVKVK